MNDSNNNFFKHTPIGSIPAEWDVATLDDVMTIRSEITQPSANGQVRYVGLEHIDSGKPRLRRWGTEAEVRSSKSKFSVGDTLYGKLRPYLDKVVLAEWEGMCATDILVFRAKEGKASPEYLVNLLHTAGLLNHAISTTTGVNHPRTSWHALKKFEFGLPPLPEQRTIAAILSKIQLAIETQEKIIERTKELKKSLMAKLFTEGLHGEELKETEIGLMPKSWEVLRLGNFVRSKITDGTHVTPKYQDAGVKFVTATNLKDEKIDFAECKLISLEEHERLTKRCKPEVGDILLSKVGTLGLVAKVEHGEEFSIFVQVALIKPKRDMLDSDYLLHALGSDAMQTQIFQKSSTSTMKYIGVGKIAELVVPIPTMEEQVSIAGILKEVNLKIYNGSQRLRLLRTLFRSMLHQLMTGTIRVKNVGISAP